MNVKEWQEIKARTDSLYSQIEDLKSHLASRVKKLEEIRTLAEEIKYCVAGYVGWHAGIEAAATKILAILERPEL